MEIIIDDDGIMHKVYTKADMVAMLEDIQLEIEELDTPNNGSAYMDCVEIIQQKIGSLKGGEDEMP